LPPPGLYARDYNWFYSADHVNNAQGNKVVDQQAFIYAQAPRLIWITDAKVLDGYLGVDALMPFMYKDLKGIEDAFSAGDLFFEGTWSGHWKHLDVGLGAGVWAPTGKFHADNPIYAGQGYWGEMLTFGATYYPDEAKRWSISALNRYEFNQEQQVTDITPGQAYTVEGGIGYALSLTESQKIDFGAIGYYQQQVTGDSGSPFGSGRDRVAAIGPEINAFFPKIMLGVSLRYAYEFLANNRFQGNTWTLTITKRF
jgi:hypothetical protein